MHDRLRTKLASSTSLIYYRLRTKPASSTSIMHTRLRTKQQSFTSLIYHRLRTELASSTSIMHTRLHQSCNIVYAHCLHHNATCLVLQTCIGHVLQCIEARATHGFRCRIGGESLLCFPRIGVMALDTPERVKYFGLRNLQSCGICRRRWGRSLARRGSDHCPQDIQDLYTQANDIATTRPQRSNRKRARERLHRHGLNYKKRCRLTDHAKVSLVQVDPANPRLFSGLIRYERMHVYFIGYCTYLIDLLVKSIKKECIETIAGVVRQCHQFRDPWTGTTHPRLQNLLKMTHLTAERRVRAVFYWAHVLAINASVVKDPIKLAAQRAVSTLQLILIAVRGHRAYTSSELDVIFKGVGQQFFMALEEIAQHHEQTEYDRRFEMHRKDPDKHTLPAPFQKTERSVTIVVYVNAFVSSTSTVFHVNVICVCCIRQISYVVNAIFTIVYIRTLRDRYYCCLRQCIRVVYVNSVSRKRNLCWLYTSN